MDVRLIELDRISGEHTQTRATLRQQAIAEYAEAIKAGERMEPGVVFDDGAALHLGAGFHPREAHRLAGRTQMECEVKQGSAWHAILHGIKDNLQHQGERLRNADKAHNIELVLRMKPGYSNSAIAELCGTSDKTVARYRAKLEATSEIPRSPHRTGRDGRTINAVAAGVRLPSHLSGQSPALAAEQGEDSNTKTVMESDRCPCGGRWMSDGNGGRFCPECHASHAENREPYPDELPKKITSWRADSAEHRRVLGSPSSERSRDSRKGSGRGSNKTGAFRAYVKSCSSSSR